MEHFITDTYSYSVWNNIIQLPYVDLRYVHAYTYHSSINHDDTTMMLMLKCKLIRRNS
jgi:hypothetical protein